ncbi:homeobox-containing protein 1-like [Centruroides sculpturatus]|uniref:homeobox-containing protein 1-like n=1 Tax=Centruroides sculpturatus TaxID=218467 RepID=UPI000C6E2551|nr:homeobox-containing protein 1-like [Centruroides sculpturatus]
MANALFTIEQVELIRRLRNSGITKEQVVMAFEQLDRLEGELGKTDTSNKLLPQNNNNSQNYESSFNELPVNNSTLGFGINKYTNIPNSNNSCQVNNGILNTLRSDLTPPMQSSFKVGDQSNSQSFSRPHSNGTSSSEGISDSNNGNVSPIGNPVTSPTSKIPTDLTIIPLTTTYTNRQGTESTVSNKEVSLSSSSSSCVPVQCMINPHDLLQEECYELEELKKKGDAEVLAEIRNFVMRYNIKQTMIAEMTKMSQAYVSRFFRGDIQDMSERTKNTFYIWYLTCKHNPWKLAQLCPNSGLRKMMSDTGDLIPMKRERFTFKAPHLAVLERYYEKDPYPDTTTREQIVEECNKAVVRQDRPLSEREKVTLPVVNNWFNNRRKEAKKQLRQHHGK